MPENVSAFEMLKIISGLGGASVLALFVFAFLKGWIVTRRELEDCQKQRDEWKEIALRDVNNTDRLQQTAEKLADLLIKQGKTASDDDQRQTPGTSQGVRRK